MARYRKIDTRIWNDKKFRELDDRVKLAFFLVLTHPNTNQLGMIRTRSVALAMELGWHPNDMSDAILMLCRMGMLMVDDKAGFIFIPNFLKYNPPNGPNAVKGWGGLIDLMPECELLTHALYHLKPFIDGLSDSLRNAMPNDIKDAIAHAMPNDIKDAPRIQEQEQEQDISTNVDKKEKIKKEKKSKSKTILSRPEDVSSEQIWSDFIALRNARHAPLTETALNIIRKEADKAGISLERALETCCMRGWQGFKAEWYHKGQNNSRFQSYGPRDLEPEFRPEDYEGGLISDLMQH